MPGIATSGKAAPAIRDFLVLGYRGADERKGPLIVLEGLRQRLPCRLALFWSSVLQEIERRLDRQLLGADLEAQTGDGLVEQPVPGGITALGFFVKQLLDAILELVRLVLAQILDPRAIRPSAGVCNARSITVSSTRLSSSPKNSKCTEAAVSRSETSP